MYLTEADVIRREQWTICQLDWGLDDINLCLRWLACRSLIANERQCDRCNRPMSLVAYRQGIDSKRWFCHHCKQRLSVRKGSFFEQSFLSLLTLVKLIYCWAMDDPQINTQIALSLANKTVIDWYNFCKDECKKFVDNNDGRLLYHIVPDFNYWALNISGCYLIFQTAGIKGLLEDRTIMSLCHYVRTKSFKSFDHAFIRIYTYIYI